LRGHAGGAFVSTAADDPVIPRNPITSETMISRSSIIAIVSSLCAIPLALTVPAAAQDEDLPTLVNNALAAMKEEKWPEALAYNQKAVELYGGNQPLVLHGPKFGRIYYLKGMCELKLGMWNEAAQSFEICYRDFPNPEGSRENNFHKMALLKWAEAAVGGGDYELALSQYQKFLKERTQDDVYPQGPFHIGMAICHYKLGNIPEGNEHLEIAIKNKERFPTPDTAIIAGFQELGLASITKRNEQALLDFIEKNRGELIIEPHLMHQYSPVFMKLAGDAIAAEMDRAAIALYQFVPTTDAAIDDVRARLKSLGPLTRVPDGSNVLIRSALEADLEALDAVRRGKRAPEMVKLAAAAFVHEKYGNTRGAYAAYLQLESFHPTSEKREDNLYNLVRTSQVVGKTADTRQFADAFIKTFPDSKHLPTVRRILLSVLFQGGKHEDCIEVAAPMLEKLESGTPEHDICLHVLGGSYFYTGQHEKAQPLLDEHVEKYPDSDFALSSSYFRAANQSRQQNWGRAAALLDETLTKHPDPATNVFLPYALYERATTHYAEEQPDAALELIARIVREFASSNVLDQAYLLRGNVEQSLENNDRAEQAFITALETAQKQNHPGVAGEALYSLILLLGDPDSPRIKDAVPYVDRYWNDYAQGSPFRTRVAVAQFPAMAAADRAKEGLERLREMIVETAADSENPGLEPLINSYTEAYLTQHTPEELRDHYFNMPGISRDNTAARALLRVAVIGVFEQELRKIQDEAQKRTAQATITALFQQLKTDFVLKDLTNNILVKLGDYLRTNTATPREALPYYDEALGRDDSTRRFAALLGRADVYGESGVAADIEKALKDFETVYNESKDKAEREFSLYRTIELLVENKEYAKAAEKADFYLRREESGFTKYSAQVGMLLARTFDERKMVGDALAMYIKIWSTYMGNIKISAPAIKRWMELSWERNNPAPDPATHADRQGAYEQGARYIELTGRFKGKMIESDLKLWQEVEQLVQTYEANPNIKSVAEIKAEKEAAQRRRR